jgi:hypothetical protein
MCVDAPAAVHAQRACAGHPCVCVRACCQASNPWCIAYTLHACGACHAGRGRGGVVSPISPRVGVQASPIPTRTHVQAPPHARMCTCPRTHACARAPTRTHVHAPTHARMCTCPRTHACARAHARMCTRPYTHACARAHARTHVHARMDASQRLPQFVYVLRHAHTQRLSSCSKQARGAQCVQRSLGPYQSYQCCIPWGERRE